jgi:hypothetical protein
MKIITILLTGLLLFMNAEVTFSEETDETTAQEDAGTTTPYLSGGIGSDERDAMAAEAKKYNLKIVFATKGKSYLADIAVKIKDESGKTIIDATSDGPWFFTNISQGKYTVIATMKQEALSQKLEIKQSGQSVLYFFWAE